MPVAIIDDDKRSKIFIHGVPVLEEEINKMLIKLCIEK